jgi:hypothetical protein
VVDLVSKRGAGNHEGIHGIVGILYTISTDIRQAP